MARSSEPKFVVLLDPDGREYSSNSPSEMNRLVYGQGYTFRDQASFQEALDFLGSDAAVPREPHHPTRIVQQAPAQPFPQPAALTTPVAPPAPPEVPATD